MLEQIEYDRRKKKTNILCKFLLFSYSFFSDWKCFSSDCIVELCKEFHWLICRSDLCKYYHAAPSVQSMFAQSHSANVAWHQISSANDRTSLLSGTQISSSNDWTSRLGFPSTAVSSSVSLGADSAIFCSVWRHLKPSRF